MPGVEQANGIDRKQKRGGAFWVPPLFILALFHFFNPADIRVNDKRVVGVVDDKAGLSAAWLFHMLFLYIVHLHLVVTPAL